MSRIEVNGSQFKHPYFTTVFFFVGEALCIILYFIDEYKLKKKYGDDNKNYPEIQEALDRGLQINSSPIKFVIPAFLDCFRSILFLIAIIFVPASVSNMMGALIVVITTLLVSSRILSF